MTKSYEEVLSLIQWGCAGKRQNRSTIFSFTKCKGFEDHSWNSVYNKYYS